MSDTTISEPVAETGRRDFLKTATLGAVAIGGIGFLRPEAAVAADAAEMITITASTVLSPEFADEAIESLQTMVKQVEAKEPGVLAYICNRGVQDRNEILFFEIYENRAAIEAHGTTRHMAEFRESAAKFFVGEVKIVPYERVQGYHR